MLDKEKRKGLPPFRGMIYLVTGVVMGVLGVLAIILIGSMMRTGCFLECAPPTPTMTFTPTLVPTSTPTLPPTWTPSPTRIPATFTPTMIPYPTQTPVPTRITGRDSGYEPYELRAFAINGYHSTFALSYWDGTEGVLEMRPWLFQRIGDNPIVTVDRTDKPYERLGFNPQPLTLVASHEKDNDFEGTAFDLQQDPIPSHEAVSLISPDGQWSASIKSGRLQLMPATGQGYDLGLEGIYNSMAFSPLSDSLAVVSRDGDDGFYLEVFSLTELAPRTLRRAFAGHLTSPVVYHPEGHTVVVADDAHIYLVSLTGALDFTISTYNTPIRFIAFDLSKGILAAAGGDPRRGQAAAVYLFVLDEKAVYPDSTRVQVIAMEDEIIGLQDASGLLVGTRHQIAYIQGFEDGGRYYGWTLAPILTTSQDGIRLYNQ